jgi:hypothetical protein
MSVLPLCYLDTGMLLKNVGFAIEIKYSADAQWVTSYIFFDIPETIFHKNLKHKFNISDVSNLIRLAI